MFGDLYLPRAEPHHHCVCVRPPPSLSFVFNVSGLEVVDVMEVAIRTSLAPSVTLWPPSGSRPSPACLCIMEKLFAFLCRSNKQAVSLGVGEGGRFGRSSGVCVLFSSPGVDKELFDGVERNESDLGQLI